MVVETLNTRPILLGYLKSDHSRLFAFFVLSRQKLTPHLNTTTITRTNRIHKKNHTCSGVEYPRVCLGFLELSVSDSWASKEQNQKNNRRHEYFASQCLLRGSLNIGPVLARYRGDVRWNTMFLVFINCALHDAHYTYVVDLFAIRISPSENYNNNNNN